MVDIVVYFALDQSIYKASSWISSWLSSLMWTSNFSSFQSNLLARQTQPSKNLSAVLVEQRYLISDSTLRDK